MNLVTLLEKQVQKRPNQLAFIDGPAGRERKVSYKDFFKSANAAAQRLSEAGIKKGQRVLVFVPMQTELYLTLTALWSLGATALFVDPTAGLRHIARCCEIAKPDAFVGIPKARLLVWISSQLRKVKIRLYWNRALRFDDYLDISFDFEIAKLLPSDPAILTFTSGSTGQPKGAIRSHGVLNSQYEALKSVIALKSGEIDMATMPVIALANLAGGLTTFIPDVKLAKPGFIDAKHLLKQLESVRPTRAGASPAFFLRMCEESKRQEVTLPEFRKIYTGGAPVFPRSLRIYAQTFTKASINVLYGSTEAEPISHVSLQEIQDEDLDKMLNMGGLLVGEVSQETQLRIIGDRWGESLYSINRSKFDALALESEGIGEIIVSGGHVVPGYLGGVGDTENKILVEGELWHRTGDAGYLDKSGRLWLLGRCSAKFVSEDKTLYPFAVECAAVEHFDLPIAACLKEQKSYTLVLQNEAKSVNAANFKITPPPASIKYLRKIPLDNRHNAKINYAKLMKKLM